MNKSVCRLLPVVGGLLMLTACGATTAAIQPPATTVTPTTTNQPPVTTTSRPPVTTTAPTPTKAPAPSCPVSPRTVALPQVNELGWVPVADRVQVRIGGLPANSKFVAGGRLVEFTVTICNNSPVNYPSIAPAVLSDHCSCAPGGPSMANGTLERFDPASGTWHKLDEFSVGTGMDYLMTTEPASPLPKGREITYRYRIAFGAGLSAGQGGIMATAVGLPKNFQAGSASLPLTVTVR
jgi:hypothetical protein